MAKGAGAVLYIILPLYVYQSTRALCSFKNLFSLVIIMGISELKPVQIYKILLCCLI